MKFFACLCCVVVFGILNAENVFVNNKKSDYVIVIPDDRAVLVFPEGETVKYAADFLNKYLQRSCGVKLPVVNEKDSAKYSKKLYLGNTDFARKNVSNINNLHPEELVVKIGENDIVICGEVTPEGIDRGSLFGVYEFCKRYLNIRWYFPDDRFYSKDSGIIVPSNPNVVLATGEIRDYPRSIQREGVLFSRYYAKRGQKQLLWDWHPATRDGGSKPYKTSNHTQYFWAKMYWDSHPEYFAKDSNNVRKNTAFKSLCYTNEAVLQQMLKNIEAHDKKPDKLLFGEVPPDKTHVYFCPNDGLLPHRFCACSDCAKLHTLKRPQGGYFSDYVFSYIKRYAEAINKRWPGRRLAVLAYSYYQLPPVNVEIPDNVDVTLVFRNSLETQEKLEENIALTEMWLKKLKNDPKRLSFWFNICNTRNEPFTASYTFQAFLQYAQKKGFRNEHFFCGFDPHTRYLPPTYSLVAYPEVYILNNLLWNPDLNIDELVKDFCNNMYGNKAAPLMYEFFSLLHERNRVVRNTGGLAPIDFIYNVKYPAAVVNKLVSLLEKANSLTTKNSLENKRITDYSRWFKNGFVESVNRYHRSSPASIPRYFCYQVDKSVKIDGKLDDIGWISVPEAELNFHDFGDKHPAIRSTFKMFRDKDNIYVGAVFKRDQKKAPLDMKKEELRIQQAIRIKDYSELYAPNIDRSWRDWYEYRITGDGTIKLYSFRKGQKPLIMKYPCKVVHTEDSVTFEMAIPAKNFLVPKDAYIQVMRYWGVWDQFYTWVPTLKTDISHYSTKNFGLLSFPAKAEDIFTGLE